MLAPLCRSDIPRQDRSRGEDYFRRDKVISLDWQDDVAYAEVAGSRQEPYAVELDTRSLLASRSIKTYCTCPRFADTDSCKHIWATILAVDHDLPQVSWGKGPIRLVTDRRISPSGAAPVPTAPGRPGPPARSTSSAPQRTSEPAPSWKARLQRVGRLIEESLPPQDASSPGVGEAFFMLSSLHPRISSGLLIDLYQRQPLQSGALGKVKKLSLKESLIPTFRNAKDREALGLLLATPDPRPELTGAYAYSSYHHRAGRQRALLPDALAELLLPKLAATGNFFLYDSESDDVLERARPMGWDGGPPWRPEVEVNIVDGNALVMGRLVRPGDNGAREIRPAGDLRLVLDSGCALFSQESKEYQWGRLEITPAHAWLRELASGGTIRIPEAEVDAFLGDLWQLPTPELLNLPEALRLEPVTIEPLPRLVIKADHRYYRKDHLLASASFDYEGRIVALGGVLEDEDDEGPSSWADVEGRKVLLRNTEFEDHARASLRQKGFQDLPSYLQGEGQMNIAPGEFFQAVEELLREGWEIRGEEGPYRSPTQSRLRVESEIDWFTVEGSLTFGDQEVPLPELLRGMRGGKRTVRLGDGSTGVLPEGWQRRLQELSDLSIQGPSAQQPDRSLRYVPSQTLLLDALLSAQEGAAQDDFHIDRTTRFLQLREQMAHLQEVEPALEPAGFLGQLRPYQRMGLAWLQTLANLGLGGCLADDMGLGKTIQVLALLQSRKNSRKNSRKTTGKKKIGHRPSLAIVPKTLVHNWIDEAHRFTPNLRVFEWSGTGRAQRWEAAGEVDLIVTTYGTLRRDIETLREVELDLAILDEAQAIKNASSQTAKACRLLPAPHRLALTGTPVENSLADLWSIFEFLNPGMLGRSKVFLDIIKSRAVSDEEAMLLRTVLSPFILRRTKEEVLPDLPEKTEQVLLCDLDGTERRLYDELRDHYHRQLKEKIGSAGLKRSKIHVLEALLRLRQAACHPGLLKPSLKRRKGSKLEVLLNHLEDATGAGHKSLVFSQFTSFLALVRQQLDDLGMPYVYLDGKTRNRKELVDRFQTDPDVPVFLISLKAGGSGLNLTAADYVFLLDPWWNPAVERQAIDRTHRIGQTRPVMAYRLIATDTVEEKVLKLQETKQQLAEAILSQSDSVLRQLTQEDLDYLLS